MGESGKCPVTFLREANSWLWEPAYFLEALGGYSHGLGIINRNQAKTSGEEILPLRSAALARVLKS